MGKARTRWMLMALALTVVAGCNRQDTDSLARIGRKVAERSQEATCSLREKINQGLPEIHVNLQDRVSRRVKWDKGLEGAHIEVKASGVEVELTGTVKTPEQRRRAFDLAENTQGVEKVQDNLKVEGENAN